MQEFYNQGVIDKCAEYGIDPRELVKRAQATAMAKGVLSSIGKLRGPQFSGTINRGVQSLASKLTGGITGLANKITGGISNAEQGIARRVQSMGEAAGRKLHSIKQKEIGTKVRGNVAASKAVRPTQGFKTLVKSEPVAVQQRELGEQSSKIQELSDLINRTKGRTVDQLQTQIKDIRRGFEERLARQQRKSTQSLADANRQGRIGISQAKAEGVKAKSQAVKGVAAQGRKGIDLAKQKGMADLKRYLGIGLPTAGIAGGGVGYGIGSSDSE